MTEDEAMENIGNLLGGVDKLRWQESGKISVLLGSAYKSSENIRKGRSSGSYSKPSIEIAAVI